MKGAASADVGAAGRFVMPRLLRRQARFVSKVFAGDVSIPRYTETLGFIAIFGATALYGAYAGGQVGNLANAVTARMGFAITEVEISGQVNTSEVAVVSALGLDSNTSLATLNVGAARETLEQLPWIENAKVRKAYPDKLEIHLSERLAFAIWQEGDALFLIERDGHVIGRYSGGGFSELPLVVGTGAAQAAAPFMDLLSAYPQFAEQVKALIHVGERRWDVRLGNGITVKLPADEPGKAVERLLTMDADNQILSRDIASIDLRLADRTTVALTENAMERRATALKARAKAIKAAARRSSI